MGNFGTMKRRGREVATRLCFVAVFICLVVVAASATPGDDYLDAKEGLLTQLAAAARENEAMKCGRCYLNPIVTFGSCKFNIICVIP